MIQNYVQLNSILDSEVAVMIAAICIMVIIFAMGFFLGKTMRIKKLEDEWNKKLAEYQKAINEILEGAGISKKVGLRKES